MVAAPAPFTHENTIYVLSQLPVEVCQVVLQSQLMTLLAKRNAEVLISLQIWEK